MSVPRYAQLASQVLARISVATTPPSSVARAAAIEAVEATLRARTRRRRARRWAAAMLGAAAAVAVALGASRYVARSSIPLGPPILAAARSPVRIVAHPMGAGATVNSAPPAAEGWTLGAGSRVFAPLDGRVMLSLSTGTTALVHEGGDMTVVGTNRVQVFRIDAGSVEFHVAKLLAGERFLVDTSDAEVEVRGTRFTVSVVREPCGANGALTRVAVAEGVVVVRREASEVRVKAGERWPTDCDRAETPAVAATALPIAAPIAPSPSASRASTLAEQNALFAAAVAAKQRDDALAALAALERLISKYPSSPLDESARAERLRLLRSLGSERAAAMAIDYLTRYPEGFARSEAEAVLAAAR